MIGVLYILGMMELIFIAICIPSVFADEHNRKMDQLNLCSRFGTKELVISKMVVGITLSWIVTLILTVATVIPTFVVYGIEGFSAPIQLMYPLCSYSLTVGETEMLLLGFLDVRFVHLFGHYFTQYQIAPIIYVVLAVIGYVGIRRSYLKYQVA